MILRNRIAALIAAAATSWVATSVAAPNSGSTRASRKAASRVVKPPRLVKFYEANFPASERAVHHVGDKVSVVLDIDIDADGKVAGATVVTSGGDAFDEAAIAAAKQFEFEPAEIDGVKSPVRIQYRYDFTLTPAAPVVPKTADFGGVVRDRKTGKPIPDVAVQLDDQTSKTDAGGRFHFPDAAPGVHAVTLTGPNFTPVGTEETLAAGHKYDATYDVDVESADVPPDQRADFEIVVIDTQLEKSVVATTVSAEQGARVAGTGGDVIKVVENLPGVARSPLGSGALIVWGAGPDDTRVYVDDVRIPTLYHQGAFRSVVNSDLVQSIELEPGGYGAAYGRGLGGLVTIGLKPLDADGYHGSVSLDAIDASASVRGSIGDNVRFAAAVRRSHLDWVLAHVTTEDVGDIIPIPQYWDSQIRVAWVPHEGESLEVGGLLSSDHIDNSLVEADPAETKRETNDSGFDRVYVRYKKQLDDGSTVTMTPFFGVDRSQVTNVFGSIPADLTNDSTVYGFRAAWTGQAADFLSLGVGVDAEVVTSSLKRRGSVTSPPREGDIYVFGQTPSDQVNADQWQTTTAGLAPFVQGDLALAGGAVHIIPGARIEPQIVTASRTSPQTPNQPALGTERENTEFEPRIAVRWAATDRIRLHAAFGLYHQPPNPEDLSSVFGNPTLGPATAEHYLAGVSYQLSKPVSVEVTSFYTHQSDLVTRSALPTPLSAQALIQDGLGRTYGTQILVRYDLTGRFFGWVSYSLLRSERTDGGSSNYRLFDFDETNVFTILGSYDLGRGYEIGSRFRYTTGFPRTPVIGTVFDARTDSYEPIFGAHNSVRIPAFYALDARLAKHFSFGGNVKLEAYLDVQNVTNHGNAEEIVYNNDYTRKSYITGLPILPVLGAKLTW